MTDPATIASALSGAKTALDLLKLVRESAGSLKTAEMQSKLADAIVALSDVRIQLADLQDVLRDKDALIARLESSLEEQRTVIRVNDAYYRVGEDGKHHGPPFCMRCWEEDKKLRSLSNPGIGGHTLCPVCKAPYDEARTGTFP